MSLSFMEKPPGCIVAFWAFEQLRWSWSYPGRDVNHIPFFWPIIKVLWLPVLQAAGYEGGNHHPWWPSNLIIPDQLSNDTTDDRKLLKFLSRRWPLYEQLVQESEGNSHGEWTSHLGLTNAQVSPISRRLGRWSWRSQCTFICQATEKTKDILGSTFTLCPFVKRGSVEVKPVFSLSGWEGGQGGGLWEQCGK